MQQQKHNSTPINEQIKARKLLVIDNTGKNIGQLSIEDALAKAEEAELDLILINPGNDNMLPIAKIYDYGKYTYELKIKNKGNKQKSLNLKEAQIRPVTNVGDLEWITNNVKRWLNDGHQVKLKINTKGRIGYNQEMIDQAYNKFVELLGNEAKIIAPLKKSSNILYTATFVKNK